MFFLLYYPSPACSVITRLFLLRCLLPDCYPESDLCLPSEWRLDPDFSSGGLFMDYNRKAHSVYLLTYHIVFVTKYRRPVITDEIGDFMKNHTAYLCGRSGGDLISAETDRDHIHLLVSMPPDVAPSRLVTTLKTQLSKEVRLEYTDHVRQYLWGDVPFWSSSYFIATTGTAVMEKVKEYIESQRTEEHKRKYVKSGRYSKKQQKR